MRLRRVEFSEIEKTLPQIHMHDVTVLRTGINILSATQRTQQSRLQMIFKVTDNEVKKNTGEQQPFQIRNTSSVS